MHLKEAEQIAQDLIRKISPWCEWVEICGSVRRMKPEVKDAEIVLISKENGAAKDQLTRLLNAKQIELAHKSNGSVLAWGERFWAVWYRGLRVDVFACDENNRGYIQWLRTGPGDANQFVVTRVKHGGAPFYLDGGYIWDAQTDQKLRVNTEEELFHLLGMDWIAPQYRNEGLYRNQFRRQGWTWGDLGILRPVAPSPKQLSMF